MMTGQQPLQ